MDDIDEEITRKGMIRSNEIQLQGKVESLQARITELEGALNCLMQSPGGLSTYHEKAMERAYVALASSSESVKEKGGE